MRIGFLGLGKMGAPMAQRLLAAGHELAVWNRTEARTKPLIREGAIAAATPAEAELGADAVFTMLFDDAAHEEVLFGPNGLMDALSPGALHISSQHHQRGAERAADRRSTRSGASILWPRPCLADPMWPKTAACGSWLRARITPWPGPGRCWSRFRAASPWSAQSRARRTP